MRFFMRLNTLLLFLVFIFAVFYAAPVFSDGLGTLSQVGKSQAQMEKILKKETKRYNSVKKAVESGAIKAGDEASSIKQRYGEPVLVVSQQDNTEKWVYKPGYASHFDNIKIYLFFDSEGRLTGIRSLNKEE